MKLSCPAVAFVLLLIGALLPAPMTAQNALVLSGGGARGLAHIGVIAYLPEVQYDADLVIGTSMGAVVGALYAAGYEAGEIERRVRSVRWSEMFDPTPVIVGPDRTVRVPALHFDLDVGRMRAGRGFFGQWRVNRALAQLLFEANARSRGSFDRLPRRFRAVAADLKTGEAVVLDSGDVARAVRASMAFPGFFAPVRWGSRVLTDGGLANNFPVSVARDLGAAFVLGVDVSKATPDITSEAPLSVIDRSLRLVLQNLATTRAPDALVAPVITEDFLGPSFPDDPAPLIKRGYEAAQRELADVKLPGTTDGGSRTPSPLPDHFSGLRVETADSALSALARHAYSNATRDALNAAAVAAATDRLYTTGLFEAIWPTVEAAADSAAPLLVVRLEAPPRLSLKAAAHFENDRGGRLWASMDRHSRLGKLPTVFSLAGAAGGLERWAAASARVYLLTRSGIAWSTGVHALERSVRFFEDDGLNVVEVFRGGGWLGVEFPHILRERLLTVVGRAEWVDVEGSPNRIAYGPLLRYTAVAAQARPVGQPLLVEAERRWGDISYTQLVFSGSRTFGRRGVQFALVGDARGVSSHAPIDVRPSLGDEHAIPGLRWGEQRGRARLVGGADLAVPLRNVFLRLRARTGAVSEKLDAWDAERWVTGAQLGLFLRTPVGALEAGYGIATIGDGRFDVGIGRTF